MLLQLVMRKNPGLVTDIEMSAAIARKYGLSLEVVDLHKEYWENVAAYAIDKIRKGLKMCIRDRREGGGQIQLLGNQPFEEKLCSV